MLERLFACVPTVLLAHCEHTPSIIANEARYRAQFGAGITPAMHPLIRDADACWRSSSLAVELANRFATRLHVLHLTTARELRLFEPGPSAHKLITAEVCVHHLLFDDRDYASLGNLIKCNPAIKTTADRDALRQALLEDRIDVIGTDHAPIRWQKNNSLTAWHLPGCRWCSMHCQRCSSWSSRGCCRSPSWCVKPAMRSPTCSR